MPNSDLDTVAMIEMRHAQLRGARPHPPTGRSPAPARSSWACTARSSRASRRASPSCPHAVGAALGNSGFLSQPSATSPTGARSHILHGHSVDLTRTRPDEEPSSQSRAMLPLVVVVSPKLWAKPGGFCRAKERVPRAVRPHPQANACGLLTKDSVSMLSESSCGATWRSLHNSI